MSSYKIKSLLENIKSNVPYWCWIGTKEHEIPIMLLDSQGEDSYTRFSAVVDERVQNGGQRGIAVVLPDGRIMISVIDADKASLVAISTFAKKQDIKALFHMKLVQLDKEGIVTRIYEKDSLWPTAAPSRMGSLEEAVTKLREMKKGDVSWFWFSTAENQSHVLINPQETDPEGTGFGTLMDIVARNYTEAPTHVVGTIRRNKTGTFTMSTSMDMDGWTQALVDFISEKKSKFPTLIKLEDMRIARISSSDIIEFKVLSDLNAPSEKVSITSVIQDRLEELAPGTSTYFLFTIQNGLYVSDSKEDLQKYKSNLENTIGLCRGRVKRNPKNYLLFQVKSDGSGLLANIAQWWHAADGPTVVPAIAKARVVQVDRDKNIIFKEKNDQLWST